MHDARPRTHYVDLMGDHDRIVRSEVQRFRGRVVKMTGDGCLAVFDGPARAVAAAAAIRDLAGEIGLEIRAGIHTGEVEVAGEDVHGLAVHIASRVMGKADGGAVVVSRTVKDLVVGSGIGLDDAGTYALKGVPGEWELYRLRMAGR